MAQPAKDVGLFEQALAAEEARHAGRLHDINKMRSDLHHLQSHLPALLHLGAQVCIADTYPIRHNGTPCLHLCSDYWGSSSTIFAALLKLGFAELHEQRVVYGSFTSVLLRYGPLHLQLHITNAAAQTNPRPAALGRRASDVTHHVGAPA